MNVGFVSVIWAAPLATVTGNVSKQFGVLKLTAPVTAFDEVTLAERVRPAL